MINTKYLWQKLGSDVQRGLRDPDVLEITLNPDGSLWFSDTRLGNRCVGSVLPAYANSFAHALAHLENKFLNAHTPYLDAVLPFSGERIDITMPPITEAVSFNIRKKAQSVFTLSDYVTSNVLTSRQASVFNGCDYSA